MFSIAIVGRPNVGKSTLFNKITKSKEMAIVFDTPGVTRDFKDTICKIRDMHIKFVDTAGFDNKTDAITVAMVKQLFNVLSKVDLLLFIIDGRSPLNELDMIFSKEIRKSGKDVILVINKVDHDSVKSDEYLKLGFKNVVQISAEHKLGFNKLLNEIELFYIEKPDESKIHTDQITLAIMGRPNAGKSTIMNRFCNEYRSIVSEIAGTTRDSVYFELEHNDRSIMLVDTAGIRKKSNIDEKIEQMSVDVAIHSMNYANVAMLVIDASLGIDSQDMKIAQMIVNEGRCIMLVLNKWDLVDSKKKKQILDHLKTYIDKDFSRVKGLPYFTISASSDKDIDLLLDEVIRIYDLWNKRITTSKINNFMRKAIEKTPHPRVNGRQIKVKFISQVKSRPPMFVAFFNLPNDISDSYKFFIENSIRSEFGFFGVPIRIEFRKSDNPFAKN